MKCAGYKKPPSKVYKLGLNDDQPPHIRLYGLGKCSVCKRIIALSPKSQTIVNHKDRR